MPQGAPDSAGHSAPAFVPQVCASQIAETTRKRCPSPASQREARRGAPTSRSSLSSPRLTADETSSKSCASDEEAAREKGGADHGEGMVVGVTLVPARRSHGDRTLGETSPLAYGTLPMRRGRGGGRRRSSSSGRPSGTHRLSPRHRTHRAETAPRTPPGGACDANPTPKRTYSNPSALLATLASLVCCLQRTPTPRAERLWQSHLRTLLGSAPERKAVYGDLAARQRRRNRSRRDSRAGFRSEGTLIP